MTASPSRQVKQSYVQDCWGKLSSRLNTNYKYTHEWTQNITSSRDTTVKGDSKKIQQQFWSISWSAPKPSGDSQKEDFARRRLEVIARGQLVAVFIIQVDTLINWTLQKEFFTSSTEKYFPDLSFKPGCTRCSSQRRFIVFDADIRLAISID